MAKADSPGPCPQCGAIGVSMIFEDEELYEDVVCLTEDEPGEETCELRFDAEGELVDQGWACPDCGMRWNQTK